jgi:hypothetical protein
VREAREVDEHTIQVRRTRQEVKRRIGGHVRATVLARGRRREIDHDDGKLLWHG